MEKRNSLFLAFLFLTMPLTRINAQTTLSGDHIVAGDLTVGSTSAPGNLQINGETGSFAAPGLKITGDGGVLFEGSMQGSMPQPAPDKTFMMWYPKKGAFLIGVTAPPESSIGEASVSLGGMWSMGIGSAAISAGYTFGAYSTAMSFGEAYKYASTAMSFGYAYGDYSTAMSGGSTWGDYTTAMSGGSAHYNYTTAMSMGTAYGDYSTAMSGGTSYGTYATAMSGGNTLAVQSVAIGPVTANSFRSVVVGSYNTASGVTPGNASWRPTDPIFVIGNGTGDYDNDPPEIANRDALVVLKNGSVKITKRQGDIVMGDFGNPGSGD